MNPISPHQVVETVPGIWTVYGGRLRYRGIDTAQDLMRQFLKMDGNRGEFMPWLRGICIQYPQSPSANHHMNWCYEALREWSDRYIFTALNYGCYCSYGTTIRVIVMDIEITINGPVIEPPNKWGPFCQVSFCPSWSSCPLFTLP